MTQTTTDDAIIIAACREAKREADREGDNWADYVDAALAQLGIDTDPDAARRLGPDSGDYTVIAVLEDGRIVHCYDMGEWAIEDAPSTRR